MNPSHPVLFSSISLRRLDALEPVVAKTRLHDPRRQARPVRSPQSMYASVRAAQVIQRGTSRVHKSPLSRKRSDDLWEKKRDKDTHRQLHYYQDDRTKENRNYFESRNLYEGYDDNLLWVRGPNGEPTDVLTDPIHNGNLTYHRYSSQPTQLDMGPCEDLLVSGEEVVLRLSVPSIPRVSSGSKAGDEPSTPQVTRRGSTRKSGTRANSGKPRGTKDIDEEQLCADIATCDTLFLDTAAQETPELIAARNLKGKLKKKKSVKPGGSKDSEKYKASKQDRNDENASGSKPSKAEDEDKESSESTPPDGKVKKKIKIVIGKKTKKVSKKNLPDKDS